MPSSFRTFRKKSLRLNMRRSTVKIKCAKNLHYCVNQPYWLKKNPSLLSVKESSLTLIQPGKGRFTLAYMSHDYLHGSHAGLPGWIRVKTLKKNA